MKSKALLGILGGMGTAAGIQFQKVFFETCHANGIKGDQNYPEWVYFNASLAPDRTDAILNIGPSPIDYLVQSLKRLQAAGADHVVVICNTAHSFREPIFNEVPLTWIDLQKETATAIKRAGYSRVALISTEGILKSGLFRKAIAPLETQYIEATPGSQTQNKLTKSIYDSAIGIKNTGSTVSADAVGLLQEVVDEFDVDAIIAGCTELSLARPLLKLNAVWIDPLEIAAQACLDYWRRNANVEKPQI